MGDQRVTPLHKLKFGRNSKTPVNANATFCDTNRSSSSAKGRPGSSAKSRSNLDVTMAMNTTTVPRMKSSLSAVPAVDVELEVGFAYNDYLQALFKQQIMKKKIHQHKTDLEDQVAQQLIELYNMDKKYMEMKNEIEKVKKLNEINELIEAAQTLLDEFQVLEKQLSLNSSADVLILYFKKHCDKIIFKNCRPIELSSDFDKMVELLSKCSECVESMLASANNSEEIGELATSITAYNDAKNQMGFKREFFIGQSQKLVYKLLEDTSDYLAAQNGY